jgi:isopentenyl-diphosphate delta-isomerase
MEERVILVNAFDEVVGFGEKMRTHAEGALHRAFSVFTFNAKNELLIQRRAESKYHSGGLWSNTACGHPRPGELTEEAARRRLREEMGLECGLERAFDFIYKVRFANGLCEHEFDHVFVGRFDGSPLPNPDEVCDWKWADLPTLRRDVSASPRSYTHWFRLCLERTPMLLGAKSQEVS